VDGDETLTFCNGHCSANLRKKSEEEIGKKEADRGKIPAIGEWGRNDFPVPVDSGGHEPGWY
jgi:hypothetical protein